MRTPLSTGILMLALIAGPAAAADVGLPAYKAPYAPPSELWNGFYLGVAGGYGWAKSNHFPDSTLFSPTTDFNQTGGLIGGTLGTNWQSGNFVLGFEGDLSWANIKGSTVDPVLCPLACTTNVEWLATVRGRTGLAWGNVMAYLTGGFAAVGIAADEVPPLFFGVNAGALRDWLPGVVGGGGFEVMFAPGWSAKAEYLFATFEKRNSLNNGNGVAVNERNMSIVRAGLNYHFGGDVIHARY